MGHVDAEICEFDAQEVGRSMAQRLSGSFVPLNAPAFIPDKQARDVILELEQVRSVRRSLQNARVAIVGIGSLNYSAFAERGTLTEDMIGELQAAGAVGEICGRFFNANGEECATPWADRVVSIALDELRQIPRVLAVASGGDRSAAIHAAAHGGLIKELLIDEGGARSLLEFARQSAGGGEDASDDILHISPVKCRPYRSFAFAGAHRTRYGRHDLHRRCAIALHDSVFGTTEAVGYSLCRRPVKRRS